MLKGSTRLLVTHQRQYLPACDRVLVLRDGQLIAQGTYAELAAAGLPEVVLTGDDVGGTLPDVETWEIGSGEAQGPLLQEEHYGEQETCSTREENGGGNKGEGALSAGTENSNAKGGEDPVQDQSVVPGQGEQSLVPGQGSTADPASTPFAAASDDVGIVEHEGSDRAGAALRKSISTYFQVGGQRCSEQVRVDCVTPCGGCLGHQFDGHNARVWCTSQGAANACARVDVYALVQCHVVACAQAFVHAPAHAPNMYVYSLSPYSK